MNLHRPASEEEAAAIVAEAAARRIPLAIEGGGTKTGIGRPAQTEATLSATALSGITLYEPTELVVGARAGTPLSEIEAALAERGQRLPFEPADYRALLGSTGEPTFGAVAACNISGPRRIAMGAARDSLLGVRFVNGRGEVIKSGGRVMKNVTGLDLVKLLGGSWGTLGFLTEVTFKALPIPETIATLVYEGLADGPAVAALSAALGSPFEVTGAAHLPAGIAGDRARTLIRIEGFAFSVDYRLKELRRLLKRYGDPAVLDEADGAALWRAVRDVTPLMDPPEAAVWRLSTAPTRGPTLAAAIAARIPARFYYDWGGGLVWLSVAAQASAAEIVRAAVREQGGHATLIRAPEDLRAVVDPFEPLDAPLARITAGLKASFDPQGIFNPGRMYAGI